jgi:hypothetical protein
VVNTWRRPITPGAPTAADAGKAVVRAFDYRAIDANVRESQRMLGKKPMENYILRKAVYRTAGPKKSHCARLVARGCSVSTVDEAIGLSRRTCQPCATNRRRGYVGDVQRKEISIPNTADRRADLNWTA